MQFLQGPQQPSLQLGGLRLPGPTIPLAFAIGHVLLEFQLRAGTWSITTLRSILRRTLVASHILLSVWLVWSIGTDSLIVTDHTLPLLEFIFLIMGEAAIQESEFWQYYSIAYAWILGLPHSPFELTSQAPLLSAYVSLMLLSVALFSHKEVQLSYGAMLSGLCLFVKTVYSLAPSSLQNHHCLAMTVAMFVCLLLASTAVQRIGTPRLKDSTRGWCDSVRQFLSERIPVAQCVRCAQAAVASLTMLGAGLLSCSLFWSCFRWRWLLRSEVPSKPAWNAFSLAGGFVYVPVLLLIKFSRRRQPSPNVPAFVQRQLIDALAGMQGAVLVYISIWIVCEIAIVT